jgi:predicted nucleotidyltransferase component of viral defense system
MRNDGRGNVAASVRARLLNLSKKRGEAFDLTLTHYALERFLFRLSQSEHRERLVLKGAMLFQVWSEIPHRATRDMDFLARGRADEQDVSRIVKGVCKTQVMDDGLEWVTEGIATEPIREDTEYGGIRARLFVRLDSAQIRVQLDIGVGDFVSPVPIEYPTLLDMERPTVLAYTREAVAAEKLDAIVLLGLANTRMKDYFDLWFFVTSFKLDEGSLARAVRQTFDRRGRSILAEVPAGLSSEFAADSAKQAQWQAFLDRNRTAGPTLEEAVARIRTLAMKAFQGARESSS